MISFRLEDYHEELKATVAGFARDVVAPVIGDYYERREFPYDIVARMAKLGLFGLPFPEEYGGMGGDLFAFCLALEELARVDSSVAITLEAAVALGAMPIYRFGTEEQRRRWLPDLCAGERLAAFGLTEPGGGSDIPGGMRTTAALVNGDGEAGGEWVIDGEVPAGTSTFPVGNDSRRTTGEIGPDERGSRRWQAGQASIDRSGMAAAQFGQTAGASDEAVAPSRRRDSCITVGGMVGSSGCSGRGRFAPQVKQMRSSC